MKDMKGWEDVSIVDEYVATAQRAAEENRYSDAIRAIMTYKRNKHLAETYSIIKNYDGRIQTVQEWIKKKYRENRQHMRYTENIFAKKNSKLRKEPESTPPHNIECLLLAE
jgi:AICAR transformylase/IMP cyclohydrolase PurH